MDLALLDRVAQRAHDVLLADDVVEGAGAVTAVERGACGHGLPNIDASPDSAPPARGAANGVLEVVCAAMDEALLENLLEWLRIPSISTGEGEPADLRRAADFAVRLVREAGGEARGRDDRRGQPARGRRAARQRPGRSDGPDLRALRRAVGRRARRLDDTPVRAADPRWAPLRRAARATTRATSCRCCTPRARSRPRGSCRSTCACWWRARRRSAASPSPPGCAPTSAARTRCSSSTAGWRICRRRRSRSGCAACSPRPSPSTAQPRDLHSGMYGGSVLNALHVLHAALAHVLPGPDGAVRDGAARRRRPRLPRRARGLGAPAERRRDPRRGRRAAPVSRARAPSSARATAPSPRSSSTGCRAARRARSSPRALRHTSRCASRRARTRWRCAPSSRRCCARACRTAPRWRSPGSWARPALFEPELPAIRLAAEAIDRATGMRTAFVRTGGSIPVVAEFAARGIPVIVTGLRHRR